MTLAAVLLVAAILLPPAALAVAAPFLPGREAVRRSALAASGAAAGAAGALFVAGSARNVDVTLVGAPGDGALVHVGPVSLPLLAVVAFTWLGGLTVAPVRTFERGAAVRSAAAFMAIALALLATSPVVLAVLLAGGTALFLAEHRNSASVLRVAGPYVVASSALLLAGASLSAAGAGAGVAAWLVLAGVLVRKGIVPLHSWLPDSFERGRLVPAVLFHCPQAGTYAAAMLVLPAAPEAALTTTAVLALVTTAYAAVLAVAEKDVRRAYGYLFMSQSALVLAGMASNDEGGVSGGFAVWVSSALGLAGLGLTIAALESRGGRQTLDRFHGWQAQMPALSVGFLVFGLATIGFPGTLGFLGEELLLGGSIERFPALGYVGIAAVTLNGITVLRMYFSLFCGRPSIDGLMRSRPVELVALGSIAAVLLAGGLLPRALVETSVDAAEATLSARD